MPIDPKRLLGGIFRYQRRRMTPRPVRQFMAIKRIIDDSRTPKRRPAPRRRGRY